MGLSKDDLINNNHATVKSITSTNAKSDDSTSSLRLDDSFEDLGLDEYYL